MRNKFDMDGQAAATGVAAEESFESAAIAKGMSVRKASRKENMEHVDFFLRAGEADEISVDVKSRKKIKRADANANDEFVWIEFKNVQGRRGWLYGKADFIAFERIGDFLIVDRKLLARLCEKLVDLTKMNTDVGFPLYTGYQRRNRQDILSLIKLSDILENIKCSTIPKP